MSESSKHILTRREALLLSATAGIGMAAGEPALASDSIKAAGNEVVQLYLKFPQVKGAPSVALRGFRRIHLEPGASQQVHFDLKPRDLGMVTEDGNPIIAQGDYTISIGGGQPETAASVATGHFHVDGQYALPE
jgi:beta-glucosidase